MGYEDRRIGPRLYRGLKKFVQRVDRRLKLSDQYRFEDRSTGAQTLVCVIAGAKPKLWPLIFPRIAAATRNKYVCIVSPGTQSDALSRMCRARNWSYLSTATKDTGLAQNVCYKLHRAANFIVKIDEDILLAPTSIDDLISAYRTIETGGVYHPSVVAPMIPLDTFCYREFLEARGLLPAFEERFGTARVSADKAPIANDVAAAHWIWNRTGPIDAIAKEFLANPAKPILCPVKINTAMVAFERAFWQETGHFPVYRRRLMVGRETPTADAEHFSINAVKLSRPAFIASNVLVGRFSFDHHYDVLSALINEQPELFCRRAARNARTSSLPASEAPL